MDPILTCKDLGFNSYGGHIISSQDPDGYEPLGLHLLFHHSLP